MDRDEKMEHRLTVLEEAVASIRFDLELQRSAWTRRSDEFRKLELAVNKMTTHQDDARRAEARQYRRLEVRIQALAVIIGLATLASPFVALAVHG